MRSPLIRTSDGWREVSFEDAYARCEELVSGVLQRHGIGAFTCFVGNPTMHSVALSRYVGVLASAFHHIYSTGTVDAWPKNVTATLMFGNAYLFPVPDVPRTDYFLCMGANPSASNGSLLALPDFVGEIDRVRERGGRVVVVDPRRTGTARHADEWIGIQPGTDAAWLLAVLHVLFAEDLVDLGAVADLVDGVEQVRDAVAGWRPEDVETFTRVPAATTRRIARELAAAPSAAVYGRIGLCTQEFGTLATWLVDVLAICTGNLDRPGGSMFARPVGTPPSWLTSTAAAGLPEFGRWRAHGTDVAEVLGQVPASCLSEEILTPGEGQLRGLITMAANPVLSVPGSDRLDGALADLECMISLDAYLNETTRHAHVILPAPSPLEQAHLGKTRILAAASHDLHQPLECRPAVRRARSATRSARAGHTSWSSALQAALDTVSELLDTLLDISKLDAGAFGRRSPESFPCGAAARAAGRRVRAAGRRRAASSCVWSGAGQSCTPTAPLFERILRNLISNAIRYTASGRVLVGCRRRGGAIRVEVWDTGIGIPKDELAHLFEEFRQLGNNPRRGDKGVGLGLGHRGPDRQAAGHADRVCGPVLGHGSCFAATVPLGTMLGTMVGLAAQDQWPEPALQAGLAGRLIAVVDNDEQVREAVTALLETWGCHPVAAASTEGAAGGVGGCGHAAGPGGRGLHAGRRALRYRNNSGAAETVWKHPGADHLQRQVGRPESQGAGASAVRSWASRPARPSSARC